MITIQPRWANDASRVGAIKHARSLVGKHYDFLGTLGFNFPERYYCSELVTEAYRQWHQEDEKFPSVIKPSELYLYGKILYDSLPRMDRSDNNE